MRPWQGFFWHKIQFVLVRVMEFLDAVGGNISFFVEFLGSVCIMLHVVMYVIVKTWKEMRRR